MSHDRPSHKRPASLDRFYYGAAYYPEHWNLDERDRDPARMAEAGFNCVRMAEFAWARLEPEEGVYRFDVFDEAIARMGAHGISTILGTPTAAPPRWLTLAYPEVVRVDADGVRMQHGSRQHPCFSSAEFRKHARRITEAMAEHFAENEYVVGWQTDNELNCHFSECHCASCQAEFQAYLRRKYEDNIGLLNEAWGNEFWSLTYGDFDEIPTPKNGKPAYANPAHLLDYYRFISWNTTRFQHDQVVVLREAQSRWFVMHNGTFAHIDYRGPFGQDLDFLGYDVYPFFDFDPDSRPLTQAFNLDHARAWTGNFMIPEQQSGPGGQAPYLHDTPEPGEVRRMAYTSLARGADSLLFFRWRTCRYGAEEYWCGVLDHDDVPRRRYDEIKDLGTELKTIGPEILGTSVYVDVGIAAADMEVYDAHSTMPFGLPSPREVARTVHTFFTKHGYAVGCVHPSDDLSDLKVYIIPHWELFNSAWLPALEAYVEGGGLLVVGARTATKDWQNNVVSDTPPGILQRLTGIKVVEYGRQNAPEKRPLDVRFYPSQARVRSAYWYEHLSPLPGARTVARWDGRHLSLKPAVVRREMGKGAVIYVGTYLTEELMEGLLPVLREQQPGFGPLWSEMEEGIQVVRREDDEKQLWFFINDGGVPASLTLPPGTELLTGRHDRKRVYLQKNEVVVVRQPRKP